MGGRVVAVFLASKPTVTPYAAETVRVIKDSIDYCRARALLFTVITSGSSRLGRGRDRTPPIHQGRPCQHQLPAPLPVQRRAMICRIQIQPHLTKESSSVYTESFGMADCDRLKQP
ncbi:hypothetical protein NPIL_268351 [Nephila pilipes]|uniref:Uncharacterized protein n=1 Tax=Nephila pilipes TaxID=299642 RepID=A0A8X6P7N3_NEPPI|nr:hypothetical protein NPIL_268351 [Nephila pilipes]